MQTTGDFELIHTMESIMHHCWSCATYYRLSLGSDVNCVNNCVNNSVNDVNSPRKTKIKII
jgi:hypothetical protein